MATDKIKVHSHYILRNLKYPQSGPIYRQIAVLESSSPFHLQFLVKRWRSDELHDYFTTYKEIENMTFAMHPTLSSALAEVADEVEQARQTGEWEIKKGW